MNFPVRPIGIVEASSANVDYIIGGRRSGSQEEP